ncbi:kinesin-like protein Klp61F [Glossina fuscipes fuscipes]
MNNSVQLANQTQRKSNQNVQVYVRIRPLNGREIIEVVSPKEIVVHFPKESKLTKTFTFDRTFGPESKQLEVYLSTVAPLIDEVLAGYNCTVFAYGQTGTGKTHTMVGEKSAELKSAWNDDSDIGIIPRALCHLFDILRTLKLEFSMRVSYLELYNEELCDLLSSDDSIKIRIFDDSTKKGSIIIQGLEEISVHSKDDVYKLLEKGKERRKTATTLTNAHSSRSHTIFSILVHIKENGLDGEEMLKIGKLNLVDLAGSENAIKTGNEKGTRAREMVNINRSLLTLGRVINALAERGPHIPYRESKLTRLLQESLGGRTKTSIIATISPGLQDMEETLGTLEYAYRAKNIQNKPEANQKLTKQTILKEYADEIDKLNRDLTAVRTKNGIYLAEEIYNEMIFKMDSQDREINENVLLMKALTEELQYKENIFNEVSWTLLEKTEELKKTEQHLNETECDLLQTESILQKIQRRYVEKRVIVESHMKTEEVLTAQASKLLEVVDVAIQDTQALHDTIDRRKEIDSKIQSVCERFSERMNNNFELMNEELNDLKMQHRNLTQTLGDELPTAVSLQTQHIEKVELNVKDFSELCEQSLTNAYNIIDDSTGSFDDLKKNFSQIEQCNQQQKLTIDHMRSDITQILNEGQIKLETHTEQLQNKVEIIKQCTEENRRQFLKINEIMEKERALECEEQEVLEKFHKDMKDIQERRFAEMLDIQKRRCAECDAMSTSVDTISTTNQKFSSELDKKSNLDFEYLKQRQVDFLDQRKIAENHSAEVERHAERNMSMCAALLGQLDNMHEKREQRLQVFMDTHDSYTPRMQHLINAYENQMKCLSLESSKQAKISTDHLKQLTVENEQHLKKHITAAGNLNLTVENALKDYAKTCQKTIKACVNDMNVFKEDELKTYTPSGSTPSRKEFTYPRELAATSPDKRIVERLHQEIDCSDIDTTMPIEEEIFLEDDHIEDSMQLLSDTQTVVRNSTLVDAEVLPTK